MKALLLRVSSGPYWERSGFESELSREGHVQQCGQVPCHPLRARREYKERKSLNLLSGPKLRQPSLSPLDIVLCLQTQAEIT